MSLEAQQRTYTAALRENAKLLERMAERKGWPVSTLTDDTLGVGWDARAKRITFPVWADEGSRLAGFRRYLPNGKPKMVGDGGLSLQPYPAPETLPNAPELWIVEGEPDVLSAHSMGVWPACGLPGAHSWRQEWTMRFRPYDLIVVCLDCDPPGRRATERVAADLAGAGLNVEVNDLAPGRSDGYDIGDYLLEAVAP